MYQSKNTLFFFFFFSEPQHSYFLPILGLKMFLACSFFSVFSLIVKKKHFQAFVKTSFPNSNKSHEMEEMENNIKIVKAERQQKQICDEKNH